MEIIGWTCLVIGYLIGAVYVGADYMSSTGSHRHGPKVRLLLSPFLLLPLLIFLLCSVWRRRR